MALPKPKMNMASPMSAMKNSMLTNARLRNLKRWTMCSKKPKWSKTSNGSKTTSRTSG